MSFLIQVLKLLAKKYVRGIEEMGPFVVVMIMIIFFGMVVFLSSIELIFDDIGGVGLIFIGMGLSLPIIFSFNTD
jgi:hypothetical protein